MLSLGRPSAKSPMKGPVSPSTRCAANFLTNNRTLCSQKTFTNPNYVNEFTSNMRPVDNSLHNFPNSCPKPTIACENTPRVVGPPSGIPSEIEGEMGRGLLVSIKKRTTVNVQPSRELHEVKEEPETVQTSDRNSPSRKPEVTMNTFNLFGDSAFGCNYSFCKSSRKSLSTASEDSSDNEEFTSEDESSDVEPASSRRRLSISESEDSFIMFDKGDVESMEDLSEEEDDEDDDDAEETTDKSGSFDEVDFCTVTRKKVTFASDEDLRTVYPMIRWSFAYQQARKGQWEACARDRCRFKDRIVRAERDIKLVLDPKHRAKIYGERFINV